MGLLILFVHYCILNLYLALLYHYSYKHSTFIVLNYLIIIGYTGTTLYQTILFLADTISSLFSILHHMLSYTYSIYILLLFISCLNSLVGIVLAYRSNISRNCIWSTSSWHQSLVIVSLYHWSLYLVYIHIIYVVYFLVMNFSFW